MLAMFRHLAVLLFLAVSALAATTSKAPKPVISCRTELGTKSISKVPRTTVTVTNKKKSTEVMVTRTTIVTYSPVPYTKTNLVFRTETLTDDAITDTYSTTTTSFAVETITLAATFTTTSTSTSTAFSTSTTIVPTIPGFQGIRDTLHKRNLGRRDEQHPHLDPRATSNKKGINAFQYPKNVVCTATMPNPTVVTTLTTLAPTTKTIPFWTTKKVIRSTVWATITEVPQAVETTIIETSVSDVTTFVTTTDTETARASTTSTSVLPGPTWYNACRDNPRNFFGPQFTHGGDSYYVSNVYNNGPAIGNDYQVAAADAKDQEACCAACQRTTGCESFMYRSTFKGCILLLHKGTTCAAQSERPGFFVAKAGVDEGAGYVVGNGRCGWLWSGNSDGTVFTVDGA